MSMVASASEHRLPHRLRGQLLQRAVTLVQEPVEVCYTPTTVEIFHQGQRVATHLSGRTAAKLSPRTSTGRRVTKRSEWTPSRMVKWAEQTGPHGTAVQAHPGREAASGDGLSIVSGDHPAGGTVLGRRMEAARIERCGLEPAATRA